MTFFGEYLDIKEIAEFAGIGERAVRKRLAYNDKYKYIARTTAQPHGGKKYEILVSSLEPELQEKIYQARRSSNPECRSAVPAEQSCIPECGKLNNTFNNILNLQGAGQLTKPASQAGEQSYASAPLSLITDNNKKNALAKYNIVKLWEEYRSQSADKKQTDNEFIAAFNAEIISPALLQETDKISRTSLYRWKRVLKNSGDDYSALINNYNYKSELEVRTSLTDEEKQEFIRIFFNDSKLNFETAYKLLKWVKEKRGETMKSMSVYRRFMNDINRLHNDFALLSREGSKALIDKAGFVLHRDISDIKPGDVLVADGNKLDFTVINPFNGKPCRAVMVVYLDWISFDVAGYEIMLSENTQCIASALRSSILRLGRIPKKVYMDNGKAFRGKFFEGTKSFNDCGFGGIYKSLGIDLMIANAYNGRSKVVERFFRNFVQSCPPAVPSYIGNNIDNRPAHYKRNEEFQKELHKDDKIPTIDQAKKIIECWLEYYRSTPCPHDKEKTVGEVFNEGKGAGVNEEMLNELMMASVERNVRRGEIKFLGLVYQSTALYGMSGKVQVKYSIFDLSKIKVYTPRGEYICDAETVKLVKAIAKEGTAADYYNFRMQLKRNKELINSTKKKTKMLLGKGPAPFQEVEWAEVKEIPAAVKEQKPKYEITNYENLFDRPKPELKIFPDKYS